MRHVCMKYSTNKFSLSRSSFVHEVKNLMNYVFWCGIEDISAVLLHQYLQI